MSPTINSMPAPGAAVSAAKPRAAATAETPDVAKAENATNDSAQIDASGDVKQKLHKATDAPSAAAPAADVPFSYADPTKGRRLDIRV